MYQEPQNQSLAQKWLIMTYSITHLKFSFWFLIPILARCFTFEGRKLNIIELLIDMDKATHTSIVSIITYDVLDLKYNKIIPLHTEVEELR